MTLWGKFLLRFNKMDIYNLIEKARRTGKIEKGTNEVTKAIERETARREDKGRAPGNKWRETRKSRQFRNFSAQMGHLNTANRDLCPTRDVAILASESEDSNLPRLKERKCSTSPCHSLSSWRLPLCRFALLLAMMRRRNRKSNPPLGCC